MKKLVSFLLIFCLAACVLPALGDAALGDKLTGPWYQVWIRDKKTGTVYGAEAVSTYSAINLATDGTALLMLQSAGEKDSHNYLFFWQETRDGVILTELEDAQNTIELKKEGEELVRTVNDEKIYYSQDITKQFPLDLPETKAADSERAFNGIWTPIRNIFEGMYDRVLHPEKGEMVSTMEIKNGSVEEVNVEPDGSETRLPYDCTYQGGELAGSVMMSDTNIDTRFRLADDDKMLMTMTTNGMTMYTVYQRVPGPGNPLAFLKKLPARFLPPVVTMLFVSAVMMSRGD